MGFCLANLGPSDPSIIYGIRDMDHSYLLHNWVCSGCQQVDQMFLFSSACHFLALSVFSDHLDLLLDDTPEFLLLMWHIRHFRFFRQFLAFFGIHQMALSVLHLCCSRKDTGCCRHPQHLRSTNGFYAWRIHHCQK